MFLPFFSNALFAFVFFKLLKEKTQGFKGQGISVGGHGNDEEEKEQELDLKMDLEL